MEGLAARRRPAAVDAEAKGSHQNLHCRLLFAAAALPALAAGPGHAAMRTDRSCILGRGCWVWARAAALQPEKWRQGSAGAVDSRLSFLFFLSSILAGKPRVAPFSSFFVLLEVSHALRAVPPGSARTVPSGGAERHGAEEPPGRDSRQRALLFRRRRVALLGSCGVRPRSCPVRSQLRYRAGTTSLFRPFFLPFFLSLPPFFFSVD